MTKNSFSEIAFDLEDAGLRWQPSVGDEICMRNTPKRVSVLFDSAGLNLEELREHYLWLPNLEQIIYQLESRQVVLKHAGLELSTKKMGYLAVLETCYGHIEARAKTLRNALGISLRDFLLVSANAIH